ncbi:unnamed protein product [Paramecium sonneborni]|uniref:Uncharacterized protein n=1 Tax=Paramecium sonneborni TaxID=65129 RepID=A0A8S1L8R3_9CILI|nr:unnamed protein product [Paramecium sonneborni]
MKVIATRVIDKRKLVNNPTKKSEPINKIACISLIISIFIARFNFK